MEGVAWRHVRIGFRMDGGMVYQKGAITAAVVVWPVDYGTGRLLAVGFSFCSPDDQFSRAVGRKQSLDMANQNPGTESAKYHVRLRYEEGMLVEDVVLFALNRLKERGVLPTWLVRRLDVFRGQLMRSAARIREARKEHGQEKAEAGAVQVR